VSEHVCLANALHTSDLIEDVDGQVVALEVLVVSAVRRVQRHEHQWKRQLFLHRNAKSFHFFRHTGLRFGHAVLRQHIGHVEIGSDFKRNRQSHRAVIGIDRFHVQHVLDTVYFLFDRCRNGLLNNLGVCAGVGCGDGNFRRRDLRVLRNR